MNEVAVIDQHFNNRLVKLVSDPAAPFSIAGNSFVTAYEDQDGVLWLCTPGGISKTYGVRSLFRVHRLGNFVPVLKSNNHITQMATDTANGSLWLITIDRQVIQYFPSNGSYRIYDLNQARPPGWDPANGVLSYVRLIDDKVLVCTTLGIYELNPGTGAIKPHRPLPSPFSHLNPVDVVSSDNRLFYYVALGKVLMYNKSTKQATLLPNLSEETVKMKPGAAYLNVRAGQPMWMYVGNGWIVGYANGKMDSVCIISDPINESYGYVNWMDTDLKGNIWISFNGVGLYKYDPAARAITHYSQAEGMRDNAVAVAVADGFGNVWSGDRHQYQVIISKTGYFYTFSVPLHQQNASWYLKMVLMKNGHMAAGAFQDLVEFFPDRLLQKPVVQAPVFSGVEVGGKMRMLTDDKTLRLEPDDNSFVVRFGLLTDRELFPYELQWKLDAFEKDWQQGTTALRPCTTNCLPANTLFG